MIIRIFFIAIMMITSALYAQQPGESINHRKITTRIGISYVPIGEIEFTNNNSSYDIYDHLSYRVSTEYYFSDLLSIGPSFEYLKENINPLGYFDTDIVLCGYYMECRINHCLTDSGANYMVFAMGTGLSSLEETGGYNGKGFCIYGVIGLDIAVAGPVGLDMLYKYQLNTISVEDRDYRFNGSTMQAGLNYRFIF
ncbi:MAG: hypothetical protein J7K40_13115 [candidate division Zixibacteria bacterium]|nr:hypothetical protein [candidate division Zixibacteria bacterium]